ncbi:MAG TPA: YraN family protein [Amycolatopsis sp.]|nr:YraN family protein [Amycolatopsis sp.]
MTSTVTTPATARHLGLGRKGEQRAAEYLQKLGFVVLSRNWRCREGEIDIVATDGHTLVVCEVKTRAGTDFGEPAEAVTEEKIARIRRIAGQWLRTFCVKWCPVRFDVIAVLARPSGELELRHYAGAF